MNMKDKATNKFSTKEEKKDTIQMNNRWLIIGSIISVIVGLILVLSGINISNSTPNNLNKDINSRDSLMNFLQKNSNYSDIIKEIKHDMFWPNEYFEINIEDKQISYLKNDSIKLTVNYKDISKQFNIKNFNTEEDEINFSKFPKLTNIETLVEENYRNNVNLSNITDEQKELSLLYNALAGHPNSYVLLGRKNGESDWRYFTPKDFPQYCIKLSDEKLKKVVQPYLDSISNKRSVPLLYNFFKDSTEIMPSNAISLDFRGDKIYYGDKFESAKMEDIANLHPPFYYEKLRSSACGWVVINKTTIKKAREFYGNNSEAIYFDNETYEKLKDLKWNKIENNNNNNTLVILLFVIGFIFIAIGCGLITYCLIYKNHDNHPSNETEKDETTTKDNDKTLSNDVKPENSIGNDHSGFDNSAIEIYKKSEEYKKTLEKVAIDAVRDFKESNEFKAILKCEIDKSINTFRASKEYVSQTKKSESWDLICNCSSESQVLSFLTSIHNQKNTFPEIRTLKYLYDKISQKCKNEKELILNLLKELDTQLGVSTGLHLLAETIINDAEYANKVRDRFEKTKKIVETYSNQKGYKEIVKQGKDLTIWERLAVMIWSTEYTNNILKIFEKESLSTEIVNKAIDIHKEDIMQIYATRIFNKYMDAPTAKAGMMASARKNTMNEKVTEMYNKYLISMHETPIYAEFTNSLDKIFDKAKNEALYIEEMKRLFVDNFVKNERNFRDKGQYLSLLIAMGLHMSDYIRYMSGNDINYCLNVKLILSGMRIEDDMNCNTEFRYKDPAYSGEYTNRVYEWLKETDINNLKALVGNKLIMP